MGELRTWDELPLAGAIVREDAPRPATGGWRTGVKPAVDLSRCVNCLLCWLWCPDSSIVLEDAVFTGFDYRTCKGCELCATVCPTDAIRMVPEEEEP